MRGDAGRHQAQHKAGAEHHHPARDTVGNVSGEGTQNAVRYVGETWWETCIVSMIVGIGSIVAL